MATATKTQAGAPSKRKPERLLFGYKPYAPNASFREVTAEMEQPLPMAVWLEHGRKFGRTIAFKDHHGTGKTSAITEWLDLNGLACVYLNAANLAPGDVIVIAPVRLPGGKIVLRELTLGNLQMDVPFAVYVDDMRQATQKVQNELLPMVCDGTIGMGRPENLELIILSDNEGAFEGIRTSEDPAMTDRLVTVPLKANDTGWRYALAAKYSDVDLKPVFRVWDSLEPELRHVLSPRCLDHVLYCTLNGFAPIMGLPILGDQRMRLVSSKKTTDGKTTVSDRTVEILEKIATGVGVAYREETPDMVRKAIKAAMRDRLAVFIQGPPGCGKTEITKALVRDAGLNPVYFSVAMTDPERLVVPMPNGNVIQAVLAEALATDEPYAIIWDEYNRPQSDATFSKLMEATQQWSIAGMKLDACRAQIALCNPSEYNGRKMNVRKNNIAQADRFTISLQIQPGDIPAFEWLISEWPALALPGDTESQERLKQITEVVVDWHKSDLGDAHRAWVSARNVQRLAELAFTGLPLQNAMQYLGEGDFAPVSLVDLEARLADRPMARLKEIASNIESWEAKLKRANEVSDEGTNDTDQVHQALSLAEVSQLWDNIDAVVRLIRFLPPKLKGTFFIGASEEEQKFWIEAFGRMTGRKTS